MECSELSKWLIYLNNWIKELMIKIKNQTEIKKMRKAGKLTAELLEHLGQYVSPGISTAEIDARCVEFAKNNNAICAPLNYHGFPKSLCTSVNNVVCHGIPSENDILQDGDLVNLDVTLIVDGYHGDTNKTFILGDVDDEIKVFVERTRNAMMRGIEAIRPGGYLSEVGKAIEKYITKFRYGIVRDYGGHGIGKNFHEDPHVFHFYTPANKVRLKPGMCFTVEPMINMGGYEVVTSQKDGWTVTTLDNSLSAQFEHTILVTDKGYEILTEI